MTFFKGGGGTERFSEKKWSILMEHFSGEIKASDAQKPNLYFRNVITRITWWYMRHDVSI